MLNDKPTLAQLNEELFDVDSNTFDSNEFHMTQHQVSQLQLNNVIDHRDRKGKWRLAKVGDIADEGRRICIHYIDLDPEEGNRWVQASTDYKNFAKPSSISKRGAHRFRDIQVNDLIMVRPRNNENQWFKGWIDKIDDESAQILIKYVDDSETKSWWSHLDDFNEIRSLQKRDLHSSSP